MILRRLSLQYLILYRFTVAIFILSGAACNTPVRDAGVDLPPPSEPNYAALLEYAQTHPAEADYTALRMHYTRTSAYQPYGGAELSHNVEMFAALRKNNYPQAIRIAQQILAGNYVSLNAHYAAWRAYSELGDTEKAVYHRIFLDNLLDSIIGSGDGRSMEMAFVTISTEELKAFLGLLGLQTKNQALIQDKNKAYDKLTVRDAISGEEFELYFDISIQLRKAANSSD
ncbi:MAG: DUF4919 domain-containing protein [Gammaproteobacteria bacterium]|nr:DUF4919 domain-containing protein [Gammaproteobacteria bacterium]